MHLCLNCKTPFVPPFGRKCYYCCDECRQEARRKQHLKANERYNQQCKSVKTKPTRKKSSPKSLDETVREIEQYNRQHGTRLTYGDWQTLKHFGKV